MHGVLLELVWLNLVVVIRVHLHENGIYVLICHREMNFVLQEEDVYEDSEFFAVKCAIVILVEFLENALHNLINSSWC